MTAAAARVTRARGTVGTSFDWAAGSRPDESHSYRTEASARRPWSERRSGLRWRVAEQPVEIEVGEQVVRVSNPSRQTFEPHGGAPPVTKLDVVQYYAAVGEQILRATYERPTTLERWPKGVFEGAVIATRMDNRGDAFYQKRIPKGAPDWVQTARITFPSGRTADEVCPTEPAVLAWAAQMGTITFHPWPVRRDDVDHPDELRLDLDPQPGTDFHDAVEVAGELHGLLDELGFVGFPKTSGGRGLHIYVRVEPRWTFTDLRHAAIAAGRELERRMPGRVTTKWWKEERGSTVFIDYNQNARDRTIACAYSLRSRPGAPGVDAADVGRGGRRRAGGLHPAHRARPGRPARRPARRHRRPGVRDRDAAGVVRARRARGSGRHAVPAGLPEDAGRAGPGAAQPQEPGQLGRRGRPECRRWPGLRHGSAGSAVTAVLPA